MRIEQEPRRRSHDEGYRRRYEDFPRMAPQGAGGRERREIENRYERSTGPANQACYRCGREGHIARWCQEQQRHEPRSMSKFAERRNYALGIYSVRRTEKKREQGNMVAKGKVDVEEKLRNTKEKLLESRMVNCKRELDKVSDQYVTMKQINIKLIEEQKMLEESLDLERLGLGKTQKSMLKQRRKFRIFIDRILVV
uniref:CCHC-type domain-containing protein n=1 Tax=Arion vulgaris TaxID=1028688 RepID=A0A0B7BQY3_9EUPU